jgi:predicted flap endonuclease-1-like 5' DNA nuclease
MDEDPRGPKRRRRRRGAVRAQGAPAAAGSAARTEAQAPAATSGAAAPVAAAAEEIAIVATAIEATATPPAKGRRRKPSPDGPERGLRDIVGAGRSQLSVSGALRARDVNRPTEADIAAAERDVAVVRRNWKPEARG